MGKGAKKRKSLVIMNIQVAHTAQQAICHLVQPGDLPKAWSETLGILLLQVAENASGHAMARQGATCKISCEKCRSAANCYQESSSSRCCLKSTICAENSDKEFLWPSDKQAGGEETQRGEVWTRAAILPSAASHLPDDHEQELGT